MTNNAFANEMIFKSNLTETENGAIAYRSTLNANLDMFSNFGTFRSGGYLSALSFFKAAFAEDQTTAMRQLFYFRDARGGQGCRQAFRECIQWLANDKEKSRFVKANFDNILYYGRGDDLLCLFYTPLKNEVMDYIYEKIESDIRSSNPSMLAKWLPSENSGIRSKTYFDMYIEYLVKEHHMKPAAARCFYRKRISALRKKLDVVERKMSSQEWEDINFSAVPSKAMQTYSHAFYRNSDKFSDYLDSLDKSGKINASTLVPSDIVGKFLNDRGYDDEVTMKVYNAQWKALTNYVQDIDNNAIVVADTSGSMTCNHRLPYSVSVGLAMYFAERANGPFKDLFITFSEQPEIQRITGDTFTERMKSFKEINATNTNIEAVFQLILDLAISSKCKIEDIPNKIYIISDMQFDEAANGNRYYGRKKYTNSVLMNSIRESYKEHGIPFPSLVFWNVNFRESPISHILYNDVDVCNVSGFSPSLFRSIANATVTDQETTEKVKLDPINIMMSTIMDERYDKVICSIV